MWPFFVLLVASVKPILAGFPVIKSLEGEILAGTDAQRPTAGVVEDDSWPILLKYARDQGAWF